MNWNGNAYIFFSGFNQFNSSQKLELFTVQQKVLLGPLFMLYSYNYDIRDHTSNPFFSWDCNGEDYSCCVSTEFGRRVGWGVEQNMDEECDGFFKQQQTLLILLFKKLIHLSPHFL